MCIYYVTNCLDISTGFTFIHVTDPIPVLKNKANITDNRYVADTIKNYYFYKKISQRGCPSTPWLWLALCWGAIKVLYEVSIQKIGIGTFVVTHSDGLNVDLLAIKNELSKINSQPKLKNMHTQGFFDFFDRTLYVLPNTIMVRHLLIIWNCLTIIGSTGNMLFAGTKQGHRKQFQSLKNSCVNAKVSAQILTLYCPPYSNNTVLLLDSPNPTGKYPCNLIRDGITGPILALHI